MPRQDPCALLSCVDRSPVAGFPVGKPKAPRRIVRGRCECVFIRMYECAFIPTRSSPPDHAAPAGRAAALDVTKSRDVTEQLSVLAPFQVLVNSAGMNRPKELVDVPDEDIDAILDLNVKRRST